MGFWEIICIIIAVRHGIIAGFLAWVAGYVVAILAFLIIIVVLKATL